ncbi:hypothetical protein [Jiella avicenniae]|uniref:Uncharacterized protein n=1 Tax=Jiella avicenniae TaxID=2907202 RepID=A0A9X1NXT7_9HYPH|nr:hypothetical protein [Jiella avicenniae]MCE7027482.1 hypothetical protein [Jiella avicenniae]
MLRLFAIVTVKNLSRHMQPMLVGDHLNALRIPTWFASKRSVSAQDCRADSITAHEHASPMHDDEADPGPQRENMGENLAGLYRERLAGFHLEGESSIETGMKWQGAGLWRM